MLDSNCTPDEVSEGWAVDAGGSFSPEPAPAAPCAGYPRQRLAELVPLLKARAFKLCRNAHESDDLVQETLLRALRFESQFIAGTNLRAWLCTVLGNVFISRCRSRDRERRTLTGWANEAELHGATRAPEPSCLGSGVERALTALPAPFAQVVRLVDLEEHAYSDVAHRLDIPVGTVMSRLFRARRLLAAQLAEASSG